MKGESSNSVPPPPRRVKLTAIHAIHDSDEDEDESDDRDVETSGNEANTVTPDRKKQSDHPEIEDDASSVISERDPDDMKYRIHGYGCESPSDKDNTEGSKKKFGLGQRLRNLVSSVQMRKMEVASESEIAPKKNWIEKFDDIIDRVLPPDPVLSGYMDTWEMEGGTAVIPTRKKNIPGGAKVMDARSYIQFLEGQLHKQAAQTNYWKDRAEQLEDTLRSLKEGSEVLCVAQPLSQVESAEANTDDDDDDDWAVEWHSAPSCNNETQQPQTLGGSCGTGQQSN